MFREFKEYQDIANLYQNKIYQTDEQIITESFESEKFTKEEAAFIEENFDALLEFVIEEETLSEQSVSDRMAGGYDKGVKSGKIPPKARVRSFSFNKGGQAVDKFKSALGKVGSKIGQFGKNVAKTATMQGSGAAKGSKFAAKGAKLLSKLGPAGKAAAVATVAGGAIAAGLASRAKKNKAAKDAAIDKQVDKYVADRRKPISNIPKKEGDAVIDGKKLNPDFKKKPEIKKEGPQVSTMTKQGKKRTPAQMMAAKRKAEGKTIQQVKDENKAKMIANARQRNVDFKAKRRKPPGEMKSNFAGGVSGKGKATDDFSKDPRYQSTAGTSTDIKKPERQMGRSAAKRRQMAGEEYTPYDIVLEYLLSSKQAATIEEANYIMTEMDAKTIQSIVAE